MINPPSSQPAAAQGGHMGPPLRENGAEVGRSASGSTRYGARNETESGALALKSDKDHRLEACATGTPVPRPGKAEALETCTTSDSANLPLLQEGKIRTAGGDARPTALPPKILELALKRADLVRLYRRAVELAGRGRGQVAKKDFVKDYNLGAWPQLYAALGKTTWQTLDRWAAMLRETGDPMMLAPKWGERWRVKARSEITGSRRGVTPEQEKILLGHALLATRPPIKEAVANARRVMRARGINPPLSDRTLARVLEDFKERRYDQWVFYRKGEKALNDEVVPYLLRDPERLQVGDCLVADGHKFNFEILNPWTSKPQRMTLILFYDMRSNYPLGWEIMPTEDVQAIAAALRRAILRLGKMPLCVYLDNGRAFGAKYFTANLEESGLGGLFENLGMAYILAKPYHGQSKTIERFFGNCAEMERRFPSYTGTSIEKKPARLLRNEKLHQRLHTKITGDFVPTIEQAHRAVAGFFDDYVERPSIRSRYLKGKCPREIFEPGAGPGVDYGQLSELMMAEKTRSIRRSEISLPGLDGQKIIYRAPEFYGRKHQVIIRYDLQDRSRIWVYETSGEFICEARPATLVHPLARITGTAADREELKHELANQERLKKKTLGAARAFTESVIVPEGRALLESRGLVEAGSGFRVLGYRGGGTDLQPVPLRLPDMAAVEAEVEEAKRRQAAETVREAAGFWQRIQELPEQERYEELLKLEVAGRELPRDELSFMRYFEQTETYQVLGDYFDDRRLLFSLAR